MPSLPKEAAPTPPAGKTQNPGPPAGPRRGPLRGWSMEKWLCWGSLGVAGVLLIAFILDIAMGIPFGSLSAVVDILGILACGLVGFLAWDALRDLR